MSKRFRPVRPWQHWRFALTVTFCWIARRHFLRLGRTSEFGIEFYTCRVCRTNFADTRRRTSAPGQSATESGRGL